MKRTTAPGATVGNRYTEGDPGGGIPATVVGDSEMNNIQEEIVNVVLDAGIALDGAIENQLLLAIRIILGLGGGLPLTQQGKVSLINLIKILLEESLPLNTT